MLGRRAVLRVAREADGTVADVAQTFDLLLAVTPYKLRETWEGFRGSGSEDVREAGLMVSRGDLLIPAETRIQSLEQKVEHKTTNGGSFDDTTLATL